MLPPSLLTYTDYIKKNPIKACKELKQLITRIEGIYAKSQLKDSDIIYDESEPKKIITFCEKLVINLEGKKLKLQDWQKYLIYCTFGFYKRDESGELRILHNQLFLLIAKKNGKSSLASALLLYYIITKPNSVSILVGVDYNQCKINFNYILDFINFTPSLKKAMDEGILYVKESPPQTIVSRENASKLLIIPETRTKAAQGQKPSFIIFDETASYRTSEIIQKLTTGMVDKNAISFQLTTGEKSIQNPAYYELERAQKVLSGKFESTNYLPLIYKLDDEDKWDDVSTYIKANPSLGVTKSIEKLKEDLEEAKQKPLNEPTFKAYHLNMFVSSTQEGIKDQYWNKVIANANKYKDLITEEKLKTYKAYASMDLSKVDDITALTVYFYIPELKKYFAKHHFYIPKETIETRFKLETEQYYNWIKSGIVTATVGITVDYEYILQDIIELTNKYPKLIGLGYDPYNASNLIEKLEEKNPKLIYSPVQQNWKIIGPMNKVWYVDILNENVIDANPFMDFCRSNAKFEIDRNNNILFIKNDYTASNLRIDGVDTSVMSHALLKAYIDNSTEEFDEVTYKKAVAQLPDLD
jgi:phage terminase large subunit-like protein